jgi:hypothetical protein
MVPQWIFITSSSHFQFNSFLNFEIAQEIFWRDKGIRKDMSEINRIITEEIFTKDFVITICNTKKRDKFN